MSTRSLTRLYISFRNTANNANSKQEHRSRAWKAKPEDEISLVGGDDDKTTTCIELGLTSLPPQWTTAVEEVQYDISKIQKQMKDLSSLHNKHLNRPSLDDSMNEEHTIDVTTQAITQLFYQSQRCIQSIQSNSTGANKAESAIIKNVVSSLASQLQDLSQAFKKAQSAYLKRMKNREDREKEYFNNDFKPTDAFMVEEEYDELYDKGFTTAQLQQLDKNDEVVKEREEEIHHIVQSIGDLNTIFKDLSVMIIDQGTILDRIDYNVEHASVQVEKGLQQLVKSEKHQKSSRKMLCILVLSVVLIIMIVALVIVKR